MQLAALGQAPERLSQTRLQETAYQSREKLDLAHRDESGRAFNLSIEREVSYYSATYDRSGTLRSRPDSLKKELKELEGALRDMGGAVRGFKQLLHRMLKAVDKEYGEWFEGAPAPEMSFREHAQVLAVSESVTLRMDTVDPEYWSAENTAGRLRDFALSLYGGGDRGAHLDKMVRAMEQGYREAEKAFGGALPSIARETVDLAKEMLSKWAEGGASALPVDESQRLDLVA